MVETIATQTVQQSVLPETKGKKKKGQKSVGFLVAKIIVFVLFALYAFTLFYAMLYAISLALKTQLEYDDSMVGLPKSWKFDNFLKAFTAVQANGKNMVVMFIRCGMRWAARHWARLRRRWWRISFPNTNSPAAKYFTAWRSCA